MSVEYYVADEAGAASLAIGSWAVMMAADCYVKT